MGKTIGIITNALKWSIKLGVGGGTVYIAHQAGLFGTSDQAQVGVKTLEKDYNNLNEDVNKQITQYSEYVPKEVLDYVPEIPKVDVKEFIPDIDLSVTSDMRGLWNKGLVFHKSIPDSLDISKKKTLGFKKSFYYFGRDSIFYKRKHVDP